MAARFDGSDIALCEVDLLSDRPRVLLVDDFAPMLDRAADVLASTCDVVGRVPDGPAALLAAATLQPEIIVLDISLPGLTGLDVAARLKRDGSTAAVVFLTLHEDEAVVKAAQTVGCLGYVVKRRLEADLVTAVFEASAGRPFMSKLETSGSNVPR